MRALAHTAVLASWVALFIYFAAQWLRARTGRSETGRRVNGLSLAGMVLELGAILAVPFFVVPDPGLPGWAYAAAAALAVGCVFLSWRAGVHLGEQLRIQAVVTDQHRLVTTGPYAVVRHPIYAALLGLLIATNLVYAPARLLLVLIPVFLIGIETRIYAEEKLLAARFGAEHAAYKRRVAAYLPGIR
jgi:protein-S-isoprenylcysteine O-methyltransferase Ste14